MTDDTNPSSSSADAGDDRHPDEEYELDLNDIPDVEPAVADDSIERNVPADSQDDLATVRDRWLRAEAELDNLRKRSRRDLEEVRRYAGLPLLTELLKVLDNLDRAIEAADAGESDEGMLEGVRMVSGQLRGTLEQFGCQKIEAVGQPFDPNLHEAVFLEPTADFAPNCVTQELRAGYSLFDRVIRPSQVAVATEPQGASANSAGDGPTATGSSDE